MNDGPTRRLIRFVAAIILLASGAFLALPAQFAGAAVQSVTNCSDSGPGSLRQAIANAASGDTVSFALSPSCSQISLMSSIRIPTNLSIVGPGVNALTVINGSDDSIRNAFVVPDGVAVAISGMTIEEMYSPTGGGISNAGALNVSNTDFVDDNGDGGAIYSTGSLNVSDSTFTGDGSATATSTGGAIYAPSGSVTVSYSTFTNDLSGDDGAAIAVGGYDVENSSPAQITGSTFSNNAADLFGGAIASDASDLQITNDQFTANWAEAGGGGVSEIGGLPPTVSDSTFTDNSSEQGGGTYGAAVVDSNFTGNFGNEGGGTYDSSVTGSSLTDNSANNQNGGGGGSYGGLILDTTYNGNSGGYAGGAVDRSNVSDSTLSDNNATYGGAAFDSTISDSTLTGNSASYGGGVDEGLVESSTIFRNSASEGGGGAAGVNPFGSGTYTLTLSLDTIADNTAPSDGGGGVFNQSETVWMEATIVSNSGEGLDCVSESPIAFNDYGYNLDDDGSCGLNALTDLSGVNPLLNSSGLQDNGGPTETVALDPDSPAIGAVSNPSLCSQTDRARGGSTYSV